MDCFRRHVIFCCCFFPKSHIVAIFSDTRRYLRLISVDGIKQLEMMISAIFIASSVRNRPIIFHHDLSLILTTLLMKDLQ